MDDNNRKVKQPRRRLKSSNKRKVLHSVDKLINSPGATLGLIQDNDGDSDSDARLKARKRKHSLKTTMLNATTKAAETGDKIKRKLSGASVSSQDEEVWEGDCKSSGGDILKQGIKFSSQDSYNRFINMPGKGSKTKKRKTSNSPASVATLNGSARSDNAAFNSSVLSSVGDEDEENASLEKSGKSGGPKARNTKETSLESKSEPASTTTDSVHRRFDSKKLREMLDANNHSSGLMAAPATTDSADPQPTKQKKSIMDKAKEKLQASRFRYLNEQLYTQTSTESAKMFKKDASLFSAYHQGFQAQANVWPSDPLDTIIAACLHLPDSHVVADMGCGEARLAKSIPNKVHSFDLVAQAPGVVECDMSKVPLKSGSVDVVVFCLSLMGTNIRDFLLEASRILKADGIVKIAEIESRFQGEANAFIRDVEKFGFKLNWKNLKNQCFLFFDFKKIRDAKSKKKLPNISLKACVYKKR